MLRAGSSQIIVSEQLKENDVFVPVHSSDPVFEDAVGFVAFFFEQQAACGVGFGNVAVELIYFQKIEYIIFHQMQAGTGITLALKSWVDKQPQCHAAVVNVQIEQIHRAHCFAGLGAHHHQTQLFVLVNVFVGLKNVLFEYEPRVGIAGIAHVPQQRIVLPLVQPVQIFGFQGSESYFIVFEQGRIGYIGT